MGLMNSYQKIRMIERSLFFILLIGISAGGFLYEIYKEEVSGGLLVFSINAYFLLCYAIYRGLLRYMVRSLAPHD